MKDSVLQGVVSSRYDNDRGPGVVVLEHGVEVRGGGYNLVEMGVRMSLRFCTGVHVASGGEGGGGEVSTELGGRRSGSNDSERVCKAQSTYHHNLFMTARRYCHHYQCKRTK
jgi:hypothetical protein